MALAAFDPEAMALPAWSRAEDLAAFIADPAKAQPAAEAISKPGETINAALGRALHAAGRRVAHGDLRHHLALPQRAAVPARGQSLQPALARRAGRGRLPGRKHAMPSGSGRGSTTRRVYQSNLPEEFLDAMTSQSVILRGPTCFWSEDGYFGGFEGSYGCCPLNCTHVWNYAQSHARLFPAVGQNMRISNFVTFLHPNGETSHREHGPHGAFIDGHCACIEAALREYQLSPDRQFLETIWPGVKKAVDWLIQAIDHDREGMPHGHQWNTYDTAVSGANTFIGSQYLAALAAGERLAERDGRRGERPALAGGPRGGHEEPEREALERRVLHPDSRAQAGPRLQHRLPRRPAAGAVVGPHARPRLSVSRRSREERPGGGDEAQLPREVRRVQARSRGGTSPTTKAG